MDIDKIFKACIAVLAVVPKLPTGGNKRRMPDAPTPEMLKRMKFDTPSDSSPTNGVSPSKQLNPRIATVRDAEEEDSEYAGRDFAPGGDADYFAEEDEEGRFFGGGLTTEQKQILNIFDDSGAEGVDDIEALSITGVRKLLLRFERAANKNQDQRSKHPDDPTKFIDSEADLDSAIKALLPLAQVPQLAYPELVRSSQVAAIVGLLSHENTDIALDIVELIHELTDEDVGNEGEDEEDGQEDRETALKALIDALLKNSILDLLVDNMSRLNEEEEADRQGIFHILGIFENIVGSNPQLAEQLALKTTLLSWLLGRIQLKPHDDNRGYAAELLSILLQNSRSNRLELGKKDGVETLLKLFQYQYRRHDPVDTDETEFMENTFDSLCSALGEPEIKELFLKSEGIDLLVLMMKEKKQSRSRSIKTLDHAMSGQMGTESCEVFVEALGLKHLFTAFMGKSSKKHKAGAPPASEDTTHTLSIVSSLFSNLPSESPARLRLLAKFVENNYEKTDKLLDIRESAQTRLKVVEKEIEAEKNTLIADGEEIDDEEDAWYLRRLDGGLYTLQTVDYILAWIVMEDDGVRSHAKQMLDRRSRSFKDVATTLRIYRDNISEDESGDFNAGLSRKEILKHLIAFLQDS